MCHKRLKSYDEYGWSIHINLIEVLYGNNKKNLKLATTNPLFVY
jgi:hypothetical protein